MRGGGTFPKEGLYMRITVKVGTSTLAHATGRLNIQRMESLCKVLSDLKNAGHEIILVSSGAIGMGVGKLNLPGRPKDMPTKQAAASLTATAMVQPWLLKINSMTETDDEVPIPSALKMGWGAYIRYVSLAVVFYEALFHLLETFPFFNWLEMLINAGSSSLLTILIIVAIESVRISGKRKTT